MSVSINLCNCAGRCHQAAAARASLAVQTNLSEPSMQPTTNRNTTSFSSAVPPAQSAQGQASNTSSHPNYVHSLQPSAGQSAVEAIVVPDHSGHIDPDTILLTANQGTDQLYCQFHGNGFICMVSAPGDESRPRAIGVAYFRSGSDVEESIAFMKGDFLKSTGLEAQAVTVIHNSAKLAQETEAEFSNDPAHAEDSLERAKAPKAPPCRITRRENRSKPRVGSQCRPRRAIDLPENG